MKAAWIALLATALPLGAGAAMAQARIDRITIVEAGLLESKTVDRLATPGTASGETAVVDQVVFYESSRQVPARVGIQFGVRYHIAGAQNGQPATVRTRWLVPAPGMRNPVSGEVTRTDDANESVIIGTDRLAGYRFGKPWEIVPGKWTLELWADDRRLASVTFTVGGE